MATRRDFIRTASLLCAGSAGAASTAEAGQKGVREIAWRDDVPLRHECDVAVVGGGIAGVSAAMSAAKSGASVLLLEEYAVVGGNATLGGVNGFCGETSGQGEAFDAIVEALQAFNAIAPYKPYPEMDSRRFDHEILAVVLQELLLRRGVKLLLHTCFVDARARGGRVREIMVCGPSGLEIIRARQYIDATGEALLAHQACFVTAKGRPGDEHQLPMALVFFVREVAADNALPQVPEGWFEPIRTKEDLPMNSQIKSGPGRLAIKIKIPKFDATDTESMTAAEIQARRRMMAVLDYYQRVEKKPWVLDACSPRIGIREGRRVVGEHVLTVDELRAAQTFEDVIARGTYYLDGHNPDDDKHTYILPPEQRTVPPYQIPFRCLVAKGAKNLLAAGRCLSADQLALSSARVMTTCSMTGQAAGIAAALCAARGCGLPDLNPVEVTRIVRERGARLDL
jgi:hypothetical protein